ncbi:MAG: hypothetical protein AAFZ87_01630 [Planctomycetota bacterium]
MSHSDSDPTVPLQTFDCTTRMFICCACIDDADVGPLGLDGACAHVGVSETTYYRSVLHRLVGADAGLAQRITDMLDVRYVDEVFRVRSHSVEELTQESRERARGGLGGALSGWAWALLTDSRAPVVTLGRQTMGEAYVRGIRSLAEGQLRSTLPTEGTGPAPR